MSNERQHREVIEVVDRIGFRFVEYDDDHDFQLGPGAKTFSNLVFIISGVVLLLTAVLGFITNVPVKAPISGQIAPQKIHNIYPRISGSISQILVKRGDHVAIGDTLAVLRAENYEQVLADLEFQRSQEQRRLAQLRESFTSREAQLQSSIRKQKLEIKVVDTSGDAQASQNEQAVLVAEKELAKAELKLAESRKTVENNRKLFDRGIIARKELDASETELELVRRDVEIREKEVETSRRALASTVQQDALGSAKGVEEMRRLESELRALESERDIELASAEYKIEDFTRRIDRGASEVERQAVTSNVEGVVLEVKLHTGAAASEQSLLAQVADIDDLHVVAYVTELNRKRIEVGLPANIKIPTYKDFEFTGEVKHISPTAQLIQNQQMYEVHLSVRAPEKTPMLAAGDSIRLLPGMSASGNVIIDRMRAIKYVVVVKMLKRS